MSMNDIMARFRARRDFQAGESRDNSPYLKGTDTDKAWVDEMNLLFNEEINRSYVQGEAEAELEKYIEENG